MQSHNCTKYTSRSVLSYIVRYEPDAQYLASIVHQTSLDLWLLCCRIHDKCCTFDCLDQNLQLDLLIKFFSFVQYATCRTTRNGKLVMSPVHGQTENSIYTTH